MHLKGRCLLKTFKAQIKVPWQYETLNKIEVPNVVKAFIGRVCINALLTKTNLFKRKIVTDPLCPIYGLEAEITGHVLWSCSEARDAWSICDRKL